MGYTVTKYPQGTFSWADALSTDQAATKKFMEAVMGWTGENMPTDMPGMEYTMFSHQGQTVAGAGPMPAEMQGVPSHWQNYVTVDDLDAMCEKATALGGTVFMPAMDVMSAGRMAGIQDPTGAHLMLWEPKEHIGATLVNVAGAMSWNELMTNDPETAKTFYGDLFGWTYEEMPMGDGVIYTVIKNNGRNNGGMMTITPEMGDFPPHWMVYFTVENAAEAVARAKEAGGSVVKDVFSADGVGKMAMIADPAGTGFMIMEHAGTPEEWVE